MEENRFKFRVVSSNSSASSKHGDGKVYYRSSDLHNVQFRVFVSQIEARELQGQLLEDRNSSWDFYVTCQLFANGEPLCLPEQTAHKNLCGGARPTYNEWLSLPITVDALPLSSVAVFNLWDCSKDRKPIAVGGTSIPVFGAKNLCMLRGRKKLFLWLGREGDGENSPENCQTPWDAAIPDEADRLERCLVHYEKQRCARIGWLDAQTFAELRSRQLRLSSVRRSDVAFLHVEFPVFQESVIYHQKEFVTSVDDCAGNEIVTVFDPEAALSNPVDDKFQRMLRMQIGLNANNKPTSQEKKELARIISKPFTKPLTEAERNMVWMFRFFLKGSVEALPKFLVSVDWSLEEHASEALQIMRESWATLSEEVALELLSEQVAAISGIRDHEVQLIRDHAVRYLDTLPDVRVTVFLLQLVQAMRGEINAVNRPLTDFLLKRARNSTVFGTKFFWYLKVEAETEDDAGVWFKSIVSEFLESVRGSGAAAAGGAGDGQANDANKIYRRQEALVRTLKELYRHLVETSRNRVEMIDNMRKEIFGGKFAQLKSFSPLPFPLNPEWEVKGLVPENCTVFKSAQKPLGLCFEKTDGRTVMVLFKVGDDLRCDQLVLQIISLMDNILKRDGNLDLALSPYNVLATGRNDGMIEIVPDSVSVAACLKANDNDIAAYFRSKHPSPKDSFGIDSKVLNNFVRSCAGYCVITYILGVGDRHLDNLLLTSNGLLFHIDFGFILGEDPKSWPPPMKITREMVMAMGGDSSEHYYQFRNLCCESFTLLRRRSNLVLSLFDLMLRAGITNGHKIFSNRDDLFKIQDKYCLDETEEVAIEIIQALLQKSVVALMPRFFEDIHSWAQYWRT